MRFIASLCLLLVCFGGSGQEKSKPAAAVVLFTVAGKPVYTDEFEYLYRKNHTKAGDFNQAKEDEYLNLLIIFKLKIAEAQVRGLDKTPAFAKEFDTYKAELKKPWTAASDDLDRLTKEAYERLQQEVNAEHILVALKADAPPADTLNAWNKIAALRVRAVGGEDFEKLAREFSDDPGGKQNGGSLGYFTAFQMVYPFESAAFATPKGEISSIIRTRFGYHIIKVLDKIPSRGEVEISHILLRTGTPNDNKIKNTIFEIYDQLKAGRSWEEMCKEYSEDTNTKNTGGKMRPFASGSFPSVPEFERMAFSMKNPGDISDPFQSKVGWHIIRLERKIAMPAYKDMEASLKRRIARDDRLQTARTRTLAKRKKDMKLSENEGAKEIVFSHADSSLIRGKWTFNDENPLVLFTIGEKPFTVRDFIAYANAHYQPTALSPSAYLSKLYDDYAEQKIDQVEEEKLEQENPEYRMLLKEYREGILLFEIMEKEVWNKASEDSTGQRKFYEARSVQYKAGDRVEARVFSTPDKPFFETIRAKIAKGDTLTTADVKRFKSIQNKKIYERGESKVIDKANWVVGTQEVELDAVYYLVEVIRLVPPGIKSFGEARASVISDYQDALEKLWVAGLREKYPVKINKKGKKAVIASLHK